MLDTIQNRSSLLYTSMMSAEKPNKTKHGQLAEFRWDLSTLPCCLLHWILANDSVEVHVLRELV